MPRGPRQKCESAIYHAMLYVGGTVPMTLFREKSIGIVKAFMS